MGYQADIEPHLIDMLDLDAFGRDIVVDGVAVVGIFSDPEKEPFGFEGLFLEKRMLYCETADVAAPVTDQQMLIDGERWQTGPVETWDGFFGAEMMRNVS